MLLLVLRQMGLCTVSPGWLPRLLWMGFCVPLLLYGLLALGMKLRLCVLCVLVVVACGSLLVEASWAWLCGGRVGKGRW